MSGDGHAQQSISYNPHDAICHRAGPDLLQDVDNNAIGCAHLLTGYQLISLCLPLRGRRRLC